MELFTNNPAENLLPRDGTVNYHGKIFGHDEAQRYFAALLNDICWQHDKVVIFGRRIVTARKVAWYGDADYAYAYSGTTKQALAWTDELRTLKTTVEALTESKFNSCLLNLYHDGNEGLSWHGDDEKSLGKDSSIASVSLGAERKFCFKHRQTGQTLSLILENGSLLVMKGTTQTYWRHSLPKSKRIKTPRINLTFRTMVSG